MNSRDAWTKANRDLIAKAIGELAYEQALTPVHTGKAVSSGPFRERYSLVLRSGVTYEFAAWRSVWDHLRVDPATIIRSGSDSVLSAGQFFIDAQSELGMDDLVLGSFLEEMQSTLHGDVRILEKHGSVSVAELARRNGNEIQAVLNGHPKILLNKGRLGWGAQAAREFAPESVQSFCLRWVAIDRDLASVGAENESDLNLAVRECLTEETLREFSRVLSERGKSLESSVLVPVHPWQWDRVIEIQYAREIAFGEIVDLGIAGHPFRPQISIRTLSNAAHPRNLDVKLPLTILNTSAVRGISGKYISGGAAVAAAMAKLCTDDPVLREARTEVLREKAGVSYAHPEYVQVKGAPYRYQETLGAIWRESVESKLGPDEIGVLTGSLFHQDASHASLIGAYIRESGLTPGAWLRKYFETVVIPLYHFQLEHGVGLVAHGQNTVLRLKRFVPAGLLLKDFQGDLRIAKGSKAEDETAFSHLDRLPPHYLIHDLITGHFVTVLRFVSETLEESDGFAESDFYRILGETVRDYLDARPAGGAPDGVNLLAEDFARVLLNRVRFKIGYADSSERPLPMVGEPLKNPLRRFLPKESPHE